MECIIIRLEAPLMSWGGDLIGDGIAPNREFPTLSTMTGLLANALGLERHQHELHQRLQDAIIMASRLDREPTRPHLTDFQTASLNADDRGWTTLGRPQGRRGGDKYESPNVSARQYLQDAVATVALALAPETAPWRAPELAQALQEPFRPLYIGRRAGIPNEPLYAGVTEAGSPLEALINTPLFWTDARQPTVRLQWTPEQDHHELKVTVTKAVPARDPRNWRSRLHGGSRATIEGTAPAPAFPPHEDEADIP